MSYQAEKISGNQVKITFTVPAEQFDAAMQQAYLKTRGRINVPGFRKGKAPRKLIENMYGEGVFYDEAFDSLFPDLYDEAVKAEGITPVDQPELDMEQIGSGKELKFSVTVFVMPEVTLGNYKGLKGVLHQHPISQEQLDHRISHDIAKMTTKQDITDRALQNGDTANIDFLGKLDGVPFPGGEGKGYDLVLGSGSFIPGFEEQVLGMKSGEEKVITVTFPTEYHEKSLAGKETTFDVKVNSASEDLKPELDDEFAQDVSEFKTFEEYRAAIQKELEEARDKQADVQLEDSLVQQAVDAADCDIPEAMIKRQTDRLLQNMQLRMLYQGLRFEDYLQYTNSTEEDVRESLRQDAINAIKTDLVLDAIGKKEDLSASEEEVEAEITRRALETNRDAKTYRDSLSEDQLSNYKELALNRKVVQMIRDAAEISVHTEEEETIDAEQILNQVKAALPEEGEEKKTKKSKAKEEKAEEKEVKPAKKPASKAKKTKEEKDQA